MITFIAAVATVTLIGVLYTLCVISGDLAEARRELHRIADTNYERLKFERELLGDSHSYENTAYMAGRAFQSGVNAVR